MIFSGSNFSARILAIARMARFGTGLLGSTFRGEGAFAPVIELRSMSFYYTLKPGGYPHFSSASFTFARK